MTKAIERHQAGDRRIASFDPQQSKKRQAFLDGAAQAAAALGDRTKLEEAVDAKLDEQEEFVRWWKETVSFRHQAAGPGRGHKKSAQVAAEFSAERAEELTGITHQQVSRWRQHLRDKAKYRSKAVDKAWRVVWAEDTAHVGHNSGENEWYTPAPIIEAARSVLGEIDLDPASSLEANTIVKARRFFSAADNGLKQTWTGRVWMNPPYAQPLVAEFSEKLAGSVQMGDVTAAIVLVNNATETAWFRRLIDVTSSLCFPGGRVRFWSASKESAAPLQGQAILYVGPNVHEFAAAFMSFGFIAVISR